MFPLFWTNNIYFTLLCPSKPNLNITILTSGNFTESPLEKVETEEGPALRKIQRNLTQIRQMVYNGGSSTVL